MIYISLRFLENKLFIDFNDVVLISESDATYMFT